MNLQELKTIALTSLADGSMNAELLDAIIQAVYTTGQADASAEALEIVRKLGAK